MWRVAVWGLALAAALVPLPASVVERLYADGFYPAFQRVVTPLSSTLPVAFLDLALLALLVVAVVRHVRASRHRGWRRASLQSALSLATAAAVVYLLFLASWGLNYRRVPLENKLAFDRSRVSAENAARLAREAVARLNAGYAAAHAGAFRPAAVEGAFAEAQRMLGGARPAATAAPKRSLLGLYFRHAAIDGMTVPVFLEIILNPDLLPVERPSILLHEWAHLAGYADESEASFVAWIAGVHSEDPVAQYSAWLDAYQAAAGALPAGLRRTLPPLDAGPRADLAAIRARYEKSSPALRQAARSAYDSYLKANRIEEGIANYGVVLQLMLGTTFEEGWKPRLR